MRDGLFGRYRGASGTKAVAAIRVAVSVGEHLARAVCVCVYVYDGFSRVEWKGV